MNKVRVIIHSMLVTVGGACGAVLLAALISNCFAVEEKSAPLHAVNAVQTNIALPYRIPGTELVVQNFVSYDGAEDVTEILAIVLENIGTEWIASCQIQIVGNETKLDFITTMLPPNSRTMVVESARSPYKKVEIVCCSGVVSHMPEEWTRVLDIEIEPVDMGSIRLLNTAPEAYDRLDVYYKAYNQEAEMYLDGISQKEVVLDLKPGEERLIYPMYYAGKYSRILLIIAE